MADAMIKAPLQLIAGHQSQQSLEGYQHVALDRTEEAYHEVVQAQATFGIFILFVSQDRSPTPTAPQQASATSPRHRGCAGIMPLLET